MRGPTRGSEGFTLVEVVVAGAVSMILALSLATIMSGLAVSGTSTRAKANFTDLQNELLLIALNPAQCALAFQDNANQAVPIGPLNGGLSGLPNVFSGDPAGGFTVSGQAIDHITLNGNPIFSAAVAPQYLTMNQIRFSHLLGPVATSGSVQTALVNLHFAADKTIGNGTIATGGNFISGNVAMQVSIDTSAGYRVTACGAGSTASGNPGGWTCHLVTYPSVPVYCAAGEVLFSGGCSGATDNSGMLTQVGGLWTWTCNGPGATSNFMCCK